MSGAFLRDIVCSSLSAAGPGLTDGVLSAGDRIRAQSALSTVRHSVFSGTLSALESVEMSGTNEESWLILFGGPKLGSESASCFREVCLLMGSVI